MTIKDGWIVECKRVDGPADKVYSQPNAGEGIVCHSIEGEDRTDDIPDRFLSTEKTPDGQYTPNAQASVMFVNPSEDSHPLIEMYPITASTWTSGNRAANTKLWAVESEGFAGTPLTAKQRERMWIIVNNWEARTGKRATRGGPNGEGRTIWQHNEVWNWSTPSAGPTACPSGRYDEFFEELAARNAKLDAEESGEEIDGVTVTQNDIDVWNKAARSAAQASNQLFGTDDPNKIAYVEGASVRELIEYIKQLQGLVATSKDLISLTGRVIALENAQKTGQVTLAPGTYKLTVEEKPNE